MNHRLSLITILGLCMTFGLGACRDKADAELGHHHHHHEHAEGHHHEHGEGHHHGEEEEDANEIQLDPEVAERLGVAADTIEPGTFCSAVEVSGRISPSSGSVATASAPKAGIVTLLAGVEPGASVVKGQRLATINAESVAGGDTNAAAKATLDAAKRELDRITPLYKDRIVTAAAYNAALQAYEEARATYSSGAASGVVTAPISGIITTVDLTSGEVAAAGSPVASIVSDATLTLTAELPTRYASLSGTFTDARIVAGNASLTISEAGGRRLSGSSTVARGAYIPLSFSFRNDGSFVPGQPVEVFLLGAPRSGVISVPIGALAEQQGQYFVYERLDRECYRKLPVTIGVSDGSRTEILSGVEPGQVIVTSGAIAVRLAESSNVAPEGHTHNH